MQTAPCEIDVLDCEKEFTFVCDQCMNILGKGRYVVSLKINKPFGEVLQLMLGVNPPIFCCGENRKVVQLFPSAKEAGEEKCKLVQYIQDHKSVDGLVLLKFNQAELIRRITKEMN